MRDLIPRSRDRGPIEASPSVAQATRLSGIPRSRDRGPIEAYMVELALPVGLEIPRSRDRGPIEAMDNAREEITLGYDSAVT